MGMVQLLRILISFLLASAAFAQTQTILTITNVPPSAAQVIAVINSGASSPVLVSTVTNGGNQALLLATAPSGTARIRAIAISSRASILRGGQINNITLAAAGVATLTLALGEITGTPDPATPASAGAGTTVSYRVTVNDPGDALANPSSAAINASYSLLTANATGESTGAYRVNSLGFQRYQIDISKPVPTLTGTYYYQVSAQALDFVTGSVVPTFYWPDIDAGQAPRQIAVAAVNTVQLTITGLPASAAFIIAALDGGSITSAVRTAIPIGGAGQLIVSLGVPAGGPYRARVAAVTAAGVILRSGQAQGLMSSSGDTVDNASRASIEVRDITGALDPATPATALSGSSVTFQAIITDPGNVLGTSTPASTPATRASR